MCYDHIVLTELVGTMCYVTIKKLPEPGVFFLKQPQPFEKPAVCLPV